MGLSRIKIHLRLLWLRFKQRSVIRSVRYRYHLLKKAVSNNNFYRQYKHSTRTWSSRIGHGAMTAVVMFSVIPAVLLTGLFDNSAHAASMGPRSATASTDCVNQTGVGTLAWTTPGNAFSSNNSYATAALALNVTSNYIKCTNFGFTLPAGSDVLGITASIERKAGTATRIYDSRVSIVKGGTIGTTNKAAVATGWPIADASANYGSTSDLWGESWAYTDINAATFGVAIAAVRTGATGSVTASVDHVTLTVEYVVNTTLEQSGYRWFNNQDIPVTTFAEAWSSGTSTTNSIALDNSGNIFAVGSDNYLSIGGYDQTLIKYNSSGVVQWGKAWGGTGDEYAYDIVLDTSGNIYVTGTSKSTGLSSETTFGDQTLVKYDSSGVEQWSKSWGGDNLDQANGIVLDTSGNIYVAGMSKSTGLSSETTNGDQTLVKYDSSGVEQWSKSWGGTGLDTANDLALDTSGNIYVAGMSKSTGLSSETTNGDQTLVKYDSSGVEQWSKSLGSTNLDQAFTITLDTSGNIFVAGSSRSASLSSSTSGGDQTLVKYNSSGVEQWTRSFTGGGTAYVEQANDIILDSLGYIYVAGTYNQDSSLLKFNSTGSIASCSSCVSRATAETDRATAETDRATAETDRATAETDRAATERNLFRGTLVGCGEIISFGTWFYQNGFESFTDNAVDSSDNVFVIGKSKSPALTSETTYGDTVLIKYNSLGAVQWLKTWGGDNLDEANAIALDTSGNIYVTGTSKSTGLSSETTFGDQTLVKYDSSGVEQWSKSWGGDNLDQANGIVLDTSGNIYVAGMSKSTGLSSETTNGDQTLVKYDSSGVEQWSKSWGGANGDYFISDSIVLDTSNNIYIAGMSSSTGLSSETANGDINLVKYNSSGVEQWSKSIGSTGLEKANDIVLDTSGNLYVAGSSDSPSLSNSSTDGLLVKFDSSGIEQWTKTWNYDGGANSEEFYDVTLDSTGNIYISAYTSTDAGVLLKITSSGTMIWGKILKEYDFNVGNDLSISSAGNLYITGKISTSYAGLFKYLSNSTADCAGQCYLVNTVLADRTITEVDRTTTEVDRTTTEVDRTTTEVNRSFSSYTGYIFQTLGTTTGIDVGSPLNGVAQNTATLALAEQQIIRLRLLLHAGTVSAGDTLKLQYAERGSDNLCDTSFSNETYTDVTSATDIAYGNNPNASDGLNLVANANDPTHSGHAVVNQEYNESNNTNIVNTLGSGEDGMWDFALKDNGAPANTAYCFRVVFGTNTVLNTYSVVPEITTLPADFNQSSYRWFDNQDGVAGDPTYAQTWGSVGWETGAGVVLDSAKNIYVVGNTNSSTMTTGQNEQMLVKYNSSGVEQWSKTWGGTSFDYAEAVALDTSGNIYVVGSSSSTGLSSGNTDQTIVKYNSSGVEQWSKSWGGTGTDVANAIVIDSSDNIYVVGESDSTGFTAGSNDQTLVKYNTSGVEQWTKTWGGTGYETTKAVTLDTSGNIYVVGSTDSTGLTSGGNDQTLIKYNTSGVEQWTKTWGGAGFDSAEAVVVDASNNVFVAGYTDTTGMTTGLYDQTLIKYNASGVEQWTKTWGASDGYEYSTAIHLDSTNNIYVAGYADSTSLSAGSTDQTLVKYNTSGVEQWSKTWGGTSNEAAYALDIDSADNVYIVGDTQSTVFTTAGKELTLLKFSSSGAIDSCASCVDRTMSETDRATAEVDRATAEVDRATTEVDRATTEVNRESPQTLVHCGEVASYFHTWGGAGTEYPYDMVHDTSGNIYVVGYTDSTGLTSGVADQLLIKYNSSGVEQWSKTWGGDSTDYAWAIALDTSGNIYVAGQSASTGFTAGGADQSLVKYNSSGVEQWSKTWGGTGSDIARAIALDTSGNIYVAGQSASTGLSSETLNGDQTLVKYNSSGVEQWSKSWGGAGLDTSYAMDLDDTGNIYIIGLSTSTGLTSETVNGDHVLVKYNSSGVEQWSKSWGGDSSDIARGIDIDTSGNIYVAGTTYSTGITSGLYDQFLIKYNSSGVEQWSKSWGGSGSEYANDIKLDITGNIYVAGYSNSTGLSSEVTYGDQTLVKYNSSGVEQWSKSWGGNNMDLINALAIDSNGNINMAGYSSSTGFTSTGTDLTLIRTLDTINDCAGACEIRTTAEVDRAVTEVDRTTTEVDRTTTEVDRTTAEVDRAVTEVVRNEVLSALGALIMDVGAPLNAVAQNTATTLLRRDTPIRLRLLLDSVQKPATVSGASVKLQYARKVGTCDTSFTGESFVDISTGTGFDYYDNPGGPDANAIATNANDPTDGNTVINQTYEEAAPFTNPSAISLTGESGLWDMALTANPAATGGTFCFRIVQNNNSLLNTYTYLPELTIPAGTFQKMRHGAVVSEQNAGVKQPFYW